MMQHLQQKEVKNDMDKAFRVITDIRDEKLGPLYKKLNMFKFNQEKEDLKKQFETTKENLQKAKKAATADIVKAYKLFRIYFIRKAHTQWDKVVQAIHTNRIIGSQ